MKRLGWFDKFLFLLNSLFAALLLLAYILPYLPPSSFALISVLSLTVPLFIIINFAFFLFWLIRFKKHFLLSFIVLLLGFNHLTSVYEVSTNEDEPGEADISVLSYNVKQFNQYGWSEEKDMPKRISDFIRGENPDIVSIQEYFTGEISLAESYPYKYIKLKNESSYFGNAIFSKYPIINSGSLDFPSKTNNNAIYTDVVVGNDTLRIINVHLQSFSLKPDVDNLEREETKRVFKGMGQTFVRQEEQIKMVLETANEVPYKAIILGDFNNTAYSYIYREVLAAGYNDAFKIVGHGFGRSFDFDYFPLRIDYILVDESLRVTSFKTMEKPFSDHFPIMATIKLDPAEEEQLLIN